MKRIGARQANLRNKLYEMIPLRTPYTVGFFVGDICNFKCEYCVQSLPETDEEKNYLVRQFMPLEFVEKAVESMKQFPEKIKNITFHGNGEPLLNKNLSKMIKIISDNDIAERIQVITNGSLLNEQLSRELIDAGLTRIIISIQGVTSQKYQEVSRVNIDMDKFIKDIKYFYDYSREHGNKCKVHIKTMNIACEHETGEDDLFYKMFSKYADTIYIDHVIENYKGIDYSELVKDNRNLMNTDEKKEVLCCPNPFFSIYVQADGSIFPCCIAHQPVLYGNIKYTTLYEAWNSKIRDNFLRYQLGLNRKKHAICMKCGYAEGTLSTEDYIDEHAGDILKEWKTK